MTEQKTLLECVKVDYAYQNNLGKTPVFNQFNLTIKTGQSLAITGQSGCGKSTLLNLLAGITTPNHGQVLFNGQDLVKINEKSRCLLRQKNIGFIYQFHHLLTDFDSQTNVMMPLLIQGISIKNAKTKANKLLQKIGLTHRAQHYPNQLSGGQRQRIAVARALVSQPKCILADEPTGNLDSDNGKIILDLLLEEHQQNQTTLIIVSHDKIMCDITTNSLNL